MTGRAKRLRSIYNRPILNLVYEAATVHREFHDPEEVQVCTLLSVKTGGCPEDCAYCPQAARYHTDVKVEKLMEVGEVLEKAVEAKESGSTRFCMGAAWREVRDNRDFDKVIDMVKGVSAMGMEVCCTLGMLTAEQAKKLKDAGLYAYNHNLDTSEEFYGEIISPREHTMTGSIHWKVCARQRSLFALVGSLVWENAKKIESVCCIYFPRCRNILNQFL